MVHTALVDRQFDLEQTSELLNLLKTQRIRDVEQRATDYKAMVDELYIWVSKLSADADKLTDADTLVYAAREIKKMSDFISNKKSKYHALIYGIHRQLKSTENMTDVSENRNMLRL